jgi:hypothetical protein
MNVRDEALSASARTVRPAKEPYRSFGASTLTYACPLQLTEEDRNAL